MHVAIKLKAFLCIYILVEYWFLSLQHINFIVFKNNVSHQSPYHNGYQYSILDENVIIHTYQLMLYMCKLISCCIATAAISSHIVAVKVSCKYLIRTCTHPHNYAYVVLCTAISLIQWFNDIVIDDYKIFISILSN